MMILKFALPDLSRFILIRDIPNQYSGNIKASFYRIIYSVDNGKLIVYVVDVGNRGDIYKRY